MRVLAISAMLLICAPAQADVFAVVSNTTGAVLNPIIAKANDPPYEGTTLIAPPAGEPIDSGYRWSPNFGVLLSPRVQRLFTFAADGTASPRALLVARAILKNDIDNIAARLISQYPVAQGLIEAKRDAAKAQIDLLTFLQLVARADDSNARDWPLNGR